jgi:hypothetical protein
MDILMDNFGLDITYYIDETVPPSIETNSGDFSTQFISGYDQQTIQHNQDEVLFIENLFKETDDLLSLDFTRVYDENNALIRIYKIYEYENIYYSGYGYDPDTIGLASIYFGNDDYVIEGDEYIEILWKDQNNTYYGYGENKNIEIYDEFGNLASGNLTERSADIIVHEIGHALGLDHPLQDPFGSWHDTVDTSMSYNFASRDESYGNYPINLDKAPQFSNTDLNALIYLHGAEETIINPDGTTRYSLAEDIAIDGNVDYYISKENEMMDGLDREHTLAGVSLFHNLNEDHEAHKHSKNIDNDPLLISSNINPLENLEEYSKLNPFNDNELEFNEISQNNIDSSSSINYEENDNLLFDNYEVKKEILSSEDKTDYFI